MLVYLYKRNTGFMKREKGNGSTYSYTDCSRHRCSRTSTHNHLTRRHTNQLAVSPTSNPHPTSPTQIRSTHLRREKCGSTIPTRVIGIELRPLRLPKRKTRGSTLRIALKCRLPVPIPPSPQKEKRREGKGNTQSSQRPFHRK